MKKKYFLILLLIFICSIASAAVFDEDKNYYAETFTWYQDPKFAFLKEYPVGVLVNTGNSNFTSSMEKVLMDGLEEKGLNTFSVLDRHPLEARNLLDNANQETLNSLITKMFDDQEIVFIMVEPLEITPKNKSNCIASMKLDIATFVIFQNENGEIIHGVGYDTKTSIQQYPRTNTNPTPSLAEVGTLGIRSFLNTVDQYVLSEYEYIKKMIQEATQPKTINPIHKLHN